MDDGLDQDRSWSAKKRNGWWIKYAALPASVAAVITLANTCGVRGLGLKTIEDAAADHSRIEAKLEKLEERTDKNLKDALGEVRFAITELSKRIDAAMTTNTRSRR